MLPMTRAQGEPGWWRKNAALESDITCPHYLLYFVTLDKSHLFFLRLTFHIYEIGITLWTSNALEKC